jgi:hypothetical protein
VILKGESEWKTWVDHAVKEYGWNDRLSVDRSYLDVNRLDQLIYKASGQLVGNTVDFIAWIKHSYGIQLHFDNLDEIALVNQELHLVALGGRVKE